MLAILLRDVGGGGPQFPLAVVFWVLFAFWIILGFVWYWPRVGVAATGPRWYGPGVHGMLTLFIFLLGWGLWGLPGIGR